MNNNEQSTSLLQHSLVRRVITHASALVLSCLVSCPLLIMLVTATAGEAHAGQLKKEKIKVGGKVLLVEVARTNDEMAKGLMFRKQLGDNEGMLFSYADEEVRRFWMKNTFIALSIGFFNKDRMLIDVQDMVPVTSELQVDIPTYQSAGPAMYALEMPKGWFKKNNFENKKGIKLEFVK